MKKLYVFYPSLILGGAENLLLRSAKILSVFYDVTVIDKKSGWISSEIKRQLITNINIIELNFNSKITLENDSILLTSANYLFQLDKYFNPSCSRLLLWSMHPNNLIPVVGRSKNVSLHNFNYAYFFSKILSFNLLAKTKKFVAKANRLDALFAMDGEVDANLYQHYGVNHSGLIPVFVSSKDIISDKPVEVIRHSNSFHILWLGRIDNDFKINILNYVLDKVETSKFAKENKIIFHIVGDGPGFGQLQDKMASIKNFNFEKHGTLLGAQLEKVIDMCDISFSMGMSALETAIRGCPTVLLDFSFTPINYDYNFKFIYESENYIVGRDLGNKSASFKEKGKNMDSILSHVYNSYSQVANLSCNYVKEFHSEKEAEKLLLQGVASTKLTLIDAVHFSFESRPYFRRLKHYFFK
ncbi:hypothetical protein [Rheinheimera metallidurans]|uniref:hypothetical protein n=1 Tax=Rheinheimera metallidurans TaxID=2925781 RepID=UPI0030034C8E